jgi:hypothetical protein
MYRFFFILILLLALFFRFFGINWDEGYHLHPDERMIIMVADRIHFPQTPAQWQLIFTPQSPLNPKFFAYGSFPIYLLKISGWLWGSDNYDGLLLAGRQLSIVFDLGTVILVFLIAKSLIGSNLKRAKGLTLIPLLASFFYAISILPIQSSHFFICDMPLTFLTTLTLYLSIRLLLNSPWPGRQGRQFLILNSIFLGVSLGLALATKITAVLLVIPIFTALLICFFRARKINPSTLRPLGRNMFRINTERAFGAVECIRPLLFSLLTILFFAIVTFAVTMPYGIIDFSTFRAHTLEQSRMRVDPFVFPFTLQYVNTTPYWYFIKNIILWGMGLPLGTVAVIGTIYVIISLLRQLISNLKRKNKITHPWDKISILVIFFIVYFLFMGNSAVKFMRYFLPIYPLFCIFGSIFVYQLIERLKLKKVSIILLIICSIMIIWPIAFTSVYTRTHTRIAASLWIYENIPTGAKLGIEHWDDSLPLLMPDENKRFVFVEFPLYEADTPQKWEMMNEKLKAVDYIVIASNRLYVPLIKLTDCQKLPIGRCYSLTADYYKKLFAGSLGFTKVAEFVSNPKINLGNFVWEIDDQSADESFTVYDHPKIMIFKKIKSVGYLDSIGTNNLIK